MAHQLFLFGVMPCARSSDVKDEFLRAGNLPALRDGAPPLMMLKRFLPRYGSWEAEVRRKRN